MDSGLVSVLDYYSSADSSISRSGHGLVNRFESRVVDCQLAEENLMPFILLLLLSVAAPIYADNQWFIRHSEGWFWYENIPEPETQKDEAESPAKPTADHPLTTRWIRKNIDHYLDTAIDYPSKENVSAYLYLDRLVKEKAERFARIGKQVIESDPMLDENVRRTISPAAAKIQDDIAYQAKEQVLKLDSAVLDH